MPNDGNACNVVYLPAWRAHQKQMQIDGLMTHYVPGNLKDDISIDKTFCDKASEWQINLLIEVYDYRRKHARTEDERLRFEGRWAFVRGLVLRRLKTAKADALAQQMQALAKMVQNELDKYDRDIAKVDDIYRHCRTANTNALAAALPDFSIA